MKPHIFNLLASITIPLIYPLGAFADGNGESKIDPALDQIKSLPYLTFTSVKPGARDKAGVTFLDRKAAQPGITFYCSEDTSGGYFIDLKGNLVSALEDRRENPLPWKMIEPYGEDRFLVLCERKGVMLIEKDSSIVWKQTGPFHHDLAVVPDGCIIALTRKKIHYPELIPEHPIIDHCIALLDRQGKLRESISIADLVTQDPGLRAEFNRHTWPYLEDEEAFDVFHANTVELVECEVAGGGKKICAPGDILFCIRNLNLIAILERETGKVGWRWGPGELDWPHAPTFLPNGNILVFDNGTHRGFSRAIELDPRSGRIVWEHRGDPPESFFTPSRGMAQRLPNGNTLLTESDHGRVFEITPAGQTVWEFYNPRRDRTKNQRATIYRMVRIPGNDS